MIPEPGLCNAWRRTTVAWTSSPISFPATPSLPVQTRGFSILQTCQDAFISLYFRRAVSRTCEAFEAQTVFNFSSSNDGQDGGALRVTAALMVLWIAVQGWGTFASLFESRQSAAEDAKLRSIKRREQAGRACPASARFARLRRADHPRFCCDDVLAVACAQAGPSGAWREVPMCFLPVLG